MKLKYKNILKNLILTFLLFTFLFGRSLMGIYIFNFRIGELIVGLNLLLTFLIFVELIINKKFDFLNKTYLILILTVFIYFVINPTSVFKLYSYRSSSYIWAISLFITVKNYSTKL